MDIHKNTTTAEQQHNKLEMLPQVPTWLARSCAVGTIWCIRLNDQSTCGPKYDIQIKIFFIFINTAECLTVDRIAGLSRMTYPMPIC